MKDISDSDIKNNLPLVTKQGPKRKVQVGGVTISGEDITMMAGPCTIEGRDQVFKIAEAVKQAGAHILRGGAFKPLTFPYGDPLLQPDANSGEPPVDRMKLLAKGDLFKAAEKRLAYLKEAGKEFDMPVISEITYAESLDMMEEYVDMYQIGYRHMFNMDLIEAVCRKQEACIAQTPLW